MGKIKFSFILLLCSIKICAQISNNESLYLVKSGEMTLQLSKTGSITGLYIDKSKANWVVSGETILKGLNVIGNISVKSSKDGSCIVSRTMKDSIGHSCVVTDVFSPDKGSIRWDLAIISNDEPWTTAINTQLKCDKPQEKLIWTAWGSPDYSGTQLTAELMAVVTKNKESINGGWSDPLIPVGFLNRNWYYGNISQICPVGNDFISLPVFTVLSPGINSGFSLVLSPEDVLLDLDLSVTENGGFQYARTNNRLGNGKTRKFTSYIVSHEASWRGGMRFIASRFAKYFEAPNQQVNKLVACGAYSGCESKIDIERMKKMAFGFNWKLSDDFPYMGMFIPPIKNADEKWKRSCAEPRPEGKSDSTSCRQLNDYAKYMKQNGFSVLGYFNVTEYGKNVNPNIGKLSKDKANNPELWKNCSEYMNVKFPNAWLKVSAINKDIKESPPAIELTNGLKGLMSNCYGAAIVDPGDPQYLRFMVEQAERHIKFVPESDGICIDRNDWVTFYNSNADDGVSWINGAPARSLYLSWNSLLSRLGPIMHKSDKIILSNIMSMRLEICLNLDGIYTEFGNNGNALNASALMCVRKPVVAWTYNKTLQDPNPDAFMQRNMYLGVFPTAPYPTNNHCIMPEPSSDLLYLDYGSLLNAMRGKKWVLTANCVETITSGVKVNLFEVPYGYALPVIFGGASESAVVKVRGVSGLDKMKVTVIQPGADKEIPIVGTYQNGVLEIVVPLKRGCGMVKLIRKYE